MRVVWPVAVGWAGAFTIILFGRGTGTIPGDINIAVNVVPVWEICIFMTKLTFSVFSNVEAVSFYKSII